MFVLIFLAVFAAVALGGWAVFALTHPVTAGQGLLIFLCKAAGVIALITRLQGSGSAKACPRRYPDCCSRRGSFLVGQPAGTPLAAMVNRA